MNTEDDGWRELLSFLSKITDTEKLNEILLIILTHEERKALSARYLIIQELLKGKKTQREMAEDLKVSIAKITRGSNRLKKVNPALKGFLMEALAL